jgi:hypothetical protein
MRKIGGILRDERGIETLEWIAIAFLIIVLVAVVVYPGGLLLGIQGVTNSIIAAL